MKLTLTPPVDPIAVRERNQLGFSTPGLSPQEVAETLAAALNDAGIPAKSFRNKHGFGERHDQWDVTVSGAVFDEVLALEHARLAKKSQRTRDEFAAKPTQFGVFVRAERTDEQSPWKPCEVTIYYTLKVRALTAFRKHLLRAVEIQVASSQQ